MCLFSVDATDAVTSSRHNVLLRSEVLLNSCASTSSREKNVRVCYGSWSRITLWRQDTYLFMYAGIVFLVEGPWELYLFYLFVLFRVYFIVFMLLCFFFLFSPRAWNNSNYQTPFLFSSTWSDTNLDCICCVKWLLNITTVHKTLLMLQLISNVRSEQGYRCWKGDLTGNSALNVIWWQVWSIRQLIWCLFLHKIQSFIHFMIRSFQIFSLFKPETVCLSEQSD